MDSSLHCFWWIHENGNAQFEIENLGEFGVVYLHIPIVWGICVLWGKGQLKWLGLVQCYEAGGLLGWKKWHFKCRSVSGSKMFT